MTTPYGSSAGTSSYSTNSLNEYTSVGGVGQSSDANGNLVDNGTYLFAYDYRNQLVRIRRKSDLAVIGTYDYDGVCRRIAKSTSAGATSFYWIGFELAMEYDASGLVSRRQRGAGFNEVVSAYQRDIADIDQDGSTTDYVPLTPLYDGAYDCVGVLDQAGSVAESYVHSYEGTVTITSGTGSAIPNTAIGWHHSYGGMYRDTESGLLYAIHRYYQPTIARWTTDDPLGRWFDRPNIGNGFGWVANKYRNRRDPLGLQGTAEREANLRMATLTAALTFIEAYGPSWAKDQLAKRRKIWKGSEYPFPGPWGPIYIEHVPAATGSCSMDKSGWGTIKIDDDVVFTSSKDRDKWGDLLTAIYHELAHDYGGVTWGGGSDVGRHPAQPAIGLMGEGTGAYNEFADAAAEYTQQHYEANHPDGGAWNPPTRDR